MGRRRAKPRVKLSRHQWGFGDPDEKFLDRFGKALAARNIVTFRSTFQGKGIIYSKPHDGNFAIALEIYENMTGMSPDPDKIHRMFNKRK